ncbi:MAG: pyridoxal 5'-phosphate synthase glutaminase subunit PdxT [Dehalococcoidia bacterium]|nr:pyridoxal 5'-phosphate synthase glutaminase subunit PdxT [Dehalococcoidia bacterium]
MAKVGVLALQGAFIEHLNALRRLGAETLPIRLAEQLEGLDALIIPGGESTTISKLMVTFRILEAIQARAQNGLSIWGTCAGMILMAKEVDDKDLPVMGLMDVSVKRNAFGRQLDSFEADLSVAVLGEEPFHAVFIRAPAVERVDDGAEVLAQLTTGPIVAVRQGRFLATAFHPELTTDLRFHRYFLQEVVGTG